MTLPLIFVCTDVVVDKVILKVWKSVYFYSYFSISIKESRNILELVKLIINFTSSKINIALIESHVNVSTM